MSDCNLPADLPPAEPGQEQVEIYEVTLLNAPSQDCLHHFDVYVADKIGFAFRNAFIYCAGHLAYIRFATKSPIG